MSRRNSHELKSCQLAFKAKRKSQQCLLMSKRISCCCDAGVLWSQRARSRSTRYLQISWWPIVTVSTTLAINDFRVTQVATAKSLGVTIDDNLDWGSHTEKIIKKVSSVIGALKRVRHLVPQATLHLIYQALIHPHFNYCKNVWWNCGITLRNKLQKLQNRAALVFTFSDYDEDACYLFEFLGWKNLACQHEIEKTTMVYKS